MLNPMFYAQLLLVASAFAQAQAITPVTVAMGLNHPWAVVFLPNGDFLVPERSGVLRVIEPDGKIGQPIRGLPAITAGVQGGLLDVELPRVFRLPKGGFHAASFS